MFQIIEPINQRDSHPRARISRSSSRSNLHAVEKTCCGAKLNCYRLKKKWRKHKQEAKVKIYEGENIDQKTLSKTSTMADIKIQDRRYSVMTKKQNYSKQNQNRRLSAATQFEDRTSINKFSTTNNQQVELHE